MLVNSNIELRGFICIKNEQIHFSEVIYFKNADFYKMTSEFFDTIKPIMKKLTFCNNPNLLYNINNITYRLNTQHFLKSRYFLLILYSSRL